MIESVSFRTKAALALAPVTLIIAQACGLNPQPIPPEQGTPDAATTVGGSGSGARSPGGPMSGADAASDSSAQSSSGDASGSGSSGSGSSSGSGGDAAAPATDGGFEASNDASTDAASDAANDSAIDAPLADAGEDARSDAACSMDSDCHASLPDVCNICASPLNYLACVSGECVCACRATDGGGD